MKKITLLIACFIFSYAMQAQWSTNTAENTLLASGEAASQYSVSDAEGNIYTMFWVNVPAPKYYELRLQKIDAAGNKKFGDNGKLVSDNIDMLSYITVSDFAIDSASNLYLSVTATNSRDGLVFIFDKDGNSLWDTNLNIGHAYKVETLPLTSGDILVASINENSDSVLQKYTGKGDTVWTSPVTHNLHVVSYMFEMSDGSVMVIYSKRNNAGSDTSSVLYAQRYDANGTPLWNKMTQLFNSSYNDYYNIPHYGFQDGDQVYVSYKLAQGNSFQAYVQRINPDGTLPWGINGSDFSTQLSFYEKDVKLAFDSGADHFWAVAPFTTTNQQYVATYVQKFDKNTGARLLGDQAKQIVPYSSPAILAVGELQLYNGNPMLLIASEYETNIALLDDKGDYAWPEETKPLATFSASKGSYSFLKIKDNEFVNIFIEAKENNKPQLFAQNYVAQTLSVDDVSTTNNIRFKNPIQNELSIKSTNAIKNITVFNMLGKQVYSNSNLNTTLITIDSQHWNSGLYLVNLSQTNGQTACIKIIKQ
ncbi:T9SS type A sorting domain-containing protein [Formosa sp. A9]|uniref:T9SS type A sorting domain-containing protein n=1 Tax=Formosa sp. A9 TaxID=3442641 RepID=UPI003EC124E2